MSPEYEWGITPENQKPLDEAKQRQQDQQAPRLVPLDEFNERGTILKVPVYPMRNGIACPTCGQELMDTSGHICTSIPPQMAIHCPSCSYRGFRRL